MSQFYTMFERISSRSAGLAAARTALFKLTKTITINAITSFNDGQFMSRSLYQQGALDGLCGPYAIVNALGHMGSRKKPDEIFQSACAAVSRNRWPALLWEGTTLGDLKKMIAACMSDIEGVSVSYPFWHVAPASNSAYWQEFDDIFEDKDALCGIIGLTRPSYHWLVVCKGGARLTFLDSDPAKSVKRVDRSSLYAGERGPREKDWVIDRRELVVFRRTG